ncbi:MAG: hemolysin family protein [Microbacteriaceae bacterium]|nr:hemolysin family protein [Microbacteriaceae bacterium]
MNEWLFVGFGVLLTVGTGFFVASEFSLVSLDRADLEARRDAGEGGFAFAIRALKRTSTHLSSAQLGITLTTLLTGWLMEPAISSLLSPVLVGWGISAGAAAVVAVVSAITLATILSMIVGELAPKNMALAVPRRVVKIVAPFQLAFTWLFAPFVTFLVNMANLIVRALGIEPKEELSSARTAEELASAVRHSSMHGTLEQDTATLLGKALSFTKHEAQDIMTPRTRIATIRVGDSATDVIALTRKTGYSRFPVIDDDADDIVGIVHVKHAVAVPRERRSEVPVGAIQGEALRVPETMNLDVLLGELRQGGYQMSIVMDEYGGTAGIATLEDLIEELIGEVSDEHDRTKADVVKMGDVVTFPASLRPDELRERAGIIVPDDGPWETVGGFLLSQWGHLPEAGATLDACGGQFVVERMDGRRIDRVRFIPQEDSDE